MTAPIYTLDGEPIRFHVDLTGQGVHPKAGGIGGESMWGILQPDGTVLVNNLPLYADEFTFRSLVRIRERTFTYGDKPYTYPHEYDGVVDEGPYETYLIQLVDKDAVFDALEKRLSFTKTDGLPDITSENFGGGFWAFCVRKEVIDVMEEILDELTTSGAIIIEAPDEE